MTISIYLIRNLPPYHTVIPYMHCNQCSLLSIASLQVCIPCNISYSAVLKLETLEEDADWLFSKLNLTRLRADWDSLAGINKKSGESEEDARVHGGPGGAGGAPSHVLAEKYFSQISRENLTRLYEKYQVDFEMFGYEGQVKRYIDMGF